MDIATYDHAEIAAKSRLSAWKIQQDFAPVTFDTVGFPTVIQNFGQLRGLMFGMHKLSSVEHSIRELGGLREDDVEKIFDAVRKYIVWHRTCFPDSDIPIPIADIVVHYLAYLKISGLTARGRVLEVGAGYGFMALFARRDPTIKQYNALEITQSLYIAQSSLYSFLYGTNFCNKILEINTHNPPENSRDHMEMTGRTEGFSIDTPRSFRCVLFPWWSVGEALRQTYDVIVSNANITEMSPGALTYYAGKWSRALSDSGCLVIQDLGHDVRRAVDEVLGVLSKAGFRALVRSLGDNDGKFLQHGNLLLVTDRHPEFELAKPLGKKRVFETNSATVRSVYGLDRPAGDNMSVREFVGLLSRRLQKQP